MGVTSNKTPREQIPVVPLFNKGLIAIFCEHMEYIRSKGGLKIP